MTPLKVICVDILIDRGSGFPNIIVLCQIGFFIFEAAKPAFNHDVIGPPAFSIHALADIISSDKINVLLTGKL